MDRREFLSWSLWGAVPWALSGGSAWGQQQQPGPRPAGNAGPGPGAAPGAGPAEPPSAPPVDPRVAAILRNWEDSSSRVTRLEGTFERYVYDSVFGNEKRSEGEFLYQAPDKGRLNFQIWPSERMPVPPENPRRVTKTGAKFKIISDTPQRWVCTGKEVLVIDDAAKTVQTVVIPPQYQGQNIADGPLPFLFGMKAEKALQRYVLSIGPLHSQQVYHLVAKPRLRQDAQEWQTAEVMLNPQTFMPQAIRTIDPAGTKETVYVFPPNKLKNNPNWLFDPFVVRNLGGYQKLQETTAEAPPESRTVPKSILK